MKHRSGNTPVILRRRPQQSRARQTSEALQEALVRLLVAHDYDIVTIRDITTLAGTGLGSFYDYFADKDDLAKVCVHLRSKGLLRVLQVVNRAPAGIPLQELIGMAVQRLLEVHRESPSHWSVHYLLERRLSGIQAYGKMYERFVNEWQSLIDLASDRVHLCSADTARTCQTIIYGLFAHAHLQGLSAAGKGIDYDRLRCQSQQALLSYLRLATA